MTQVITPNRHDRDKTTPTPNAPTSEKGGEQVSLSATELVGGALASVLAAWAGSRFGLAGTLIGAALTSLLIATSREFFIAGLRRTRRSVMDAVQRRREEASASADDTIPYRVDAVVAQTPQKRRPGRTLLKLLGIVGSALAIFALAMVAITGVEKLTGSSLDGGKGTTITQVRTANENAKESESPQDAPALPIPSFEPSLPAPSDPIGGPTTDKPAPQAPESETSDPPASQTTRAPKTEGGSDS